MRPLIAVVAVLGTAACAEPMAVVSETPRSIAICRDTGQQSLQDVTDVAERHCQQHGLHAEFADESRGICRGIAVGRHRVATFRCVQ